MRKSNKMLETTPSPYLPFHFQLLYLLLFCSASYMRDGELWSFCKGSSCFSSTPVWVLPMGCSPSGQTCSCMGSPLAAVPSGYSHQLYHISLYGMQVNFCSSAWSTSSPSSSSHLYSHGAISYTLLLPARQHFLPFVYTCSPPAL